VKQIQYLLAQIGLEPQRVRMFNMSSAMAGEFVTAVNAMTKAIIELGPSPLRSSKPDALLPQGHR
jgi:coenzyme F420-reducing hydrogenase delta subunit